MHVQLTKPEIEKFVAEKVKAGEFPTVEAVVEDALTRMMVDEVTLSNVDIAEIAAADAEIDRGEYVDFDVFSAAMRRKYCKP